MSVIKRYKRKDKTIFYEAVIYVRGVRVACKCFDKRSDAYIWHDKQKERLGVSPGLLKKQNRTRIFLEAVKLYQKENLPLLTKSTQQTVEVRYNYFAKGPLAKVKMSQLNDEHIDLWLDWLKEHPTAKNPRRKSFKHELKYLNAILNWYRNFIDFSFIVPITKRHKMKCVYKPIPQRRPDHFIRPEDVRKWIKWLREHRSNPVYWRLATFMILTGARVGEACGLMWDVVDLEKGIARIIRKVSWDQRSKAPYLEERVKTKESFRIIVLPKELVKILKAIRKEHPNRKLIFSDRHGYFLKYNAIQSSYNHGFMALGLPWRSTHICRHTYATMALFATRDISSVQASLGHANQKMTERYAKIVKLISSDTAEKTAKAFNLFSDDNPLEEKQLEISENLNLFS